MKWANKPPSRKRSIDLCMTNTPDKIVRSGIMPLGISDHSLVYLIRKIHYVIPGCIKIISTRSFKNINRDLKQ